MEVRTRIAPAPTGFLHVGTARAALFNWLFARKQKGAFIVRIEDTDKERSKKEFEKDILEGFEWLGLEWDGLYRQSERIELYKSYLKKLLEEKKAFWCPHTKEELEAEAERQRAAKEPPCHRCSARDEQQEHGELIRLKIPPGKKICFNDIVRGEICFESDFLSDISLAKDLQTPLYNFAAVMDDYEMRISHVIRGEDHISNTPKQILIGRALGFAEPVWAHMALILGKDRSKLSKRHGATALREYREQGYLPEAMLNYLSLLGWNPGDEREIMSREELIEAFSLERLQKSGAIFDSDKLDWMNGEYIRKKPIKELTKLSMPYLEKESYFSQASPPVAINIEGTIRIEQPRLKKLSEIGERVNYFFREPEYDKKLLRWKDMSDEEILASLKRSGKIISNFTGQISKEKIEKAFLEEIGKSDKGVLLWPLRVALSGRKASPGPFEIMEALGKEETMARIQIALDKLKNI